MYTELNGVTAKPKLWNIYTADKLWTDAHITKQMLSFHLNPEINAASRSFDFIDESTDWLINEFNLGAESKVIDFGCGPGLYTQRLKQKGVGTVVGVDFSENSINYGKVQAESKNLEIDYRIANYLEYKDDDKYDLITLVMCDFCALSPEQRALLLKKFKSMLKPNGAIALDVFTENRFNCLQETTELHKNYMNNFWSWADYWCIHSSCGYSSELVWLDKYVIIEKTRMWEVYNWLQHFTVEMLESEVSSNGLRIENLYSNLCGKPYEKSDEMAVVIKAK